MNKEEWAAQKQAQRREAYETIDKTCTEMMTSPEAMQLKDYGSWKQSRVYVDKDAAKVTILEPSKEYTRGYGTKAVGYNAKVVYESFQSAHWCYSVLSLRCRN